MSKHYDEIMQGFEEAIIYNQCDHEWEFINESIEITYVSKIYRCNKCKAVRCTASDDFD
jgi:hypothetical protein